MKLSAAICPCCGASIEIPEDRDRCFCSYCGSQILTEAAFAFAKIRIEGTVQIKAADFIIEAGKLREYHGESTSPAIPDNVDTIGAEAFAGKSIRTIYIPNSVIEIEQEAFKGCLKLESITIPDSVKTIGDAAFALCGSLNSVKLPHDLRRIAPWSFAGCSSLERVDIPDSVETISGSAFKLCSALSWVKLPSSLQQLGPEAFKDCGSLTVVEGYDGRWKHPFEGTPFLEERGKGSFLGGGFLRSKR